MTVYSHIIENVRKTSEACVKCLLRRGEVTEWLKVTVLKTVVAQATAGSNPVLSANSAKIIKIQ